MANNIMTKAKDAALKLLPLSNTIVFESVPFLSDNTKYVYDELVNRGYNQKYKMVWMQWEETDRLPTVKNVRAINPKKNKIQWWYYLATAKCLICCNRYVGKLRQSQKCFYLMHGTPIKSLKNNRGVPDVFDYMLTAGENVNAISAREFQFDEARAVPLGFPRNDILGMDSTVLLDQLFGKYDKYIIWYPTFRQNKTGLKTGSENALPIVYDAERARALNDFASENQIAIIIKPHFAQDMRYFKEIHLSNIKIIDDEFFVQKQITSYELVNACDSLITDYSSIYFDYTLCDKPVAVIWEDIEDYRRNPGFCIDIDHYLRGAEKIYNLEDFFEYLKRIRNGEDILRDERRAVRDACNYSTDHCNAKRVADFIIEKAGLSL